MSSPKTRAIAIASLLSTAHPAVTGPDAPSPVHMEESDSQIRVWTQLPAALSEATRLKILDFLTVNADRFGHDVRSNGPSLLWAEVHQHPPPNPAASEPEDAP